MARPASKTSTAPDKYIDQALVIIEESGVEGLSLREVARRLGVSHQAPYRHFSSRDHVIAELIRRGFDEFSGHMRAITPPADAFAHLRMLGRAYLAFAAEKPLHYRLMFGSPLPDGEEFAAMRGASVASFAILLDAIAAIWRQGGQEPKPADLERDAMFVWSTVHGFAELRGKMVKRQGVVDFAAPHAEEAVLQRIEDGLREGLRLG